MLSLAKTALGAIVVLSESKCFLTLMSVSTNSFEHKS